MQYLLIGAVALLSLANGANDNFKGVATLWGSGVTSYRRALAWATVFTFLGSIYGSLIHGRSEHENRYRNNMGLENREDATPRGDHSIVSFR